MQVAWHGRVHRSDIIFVLSCHGQIDIAGRGTGESERSRDRLSSTSLPAYHTPGEAKCES